MISDMKEIYELVRKSNELYNSADHLTYVTYPLVKDLKLIITILDNLHKSLELGMDAVLQYERLYKRIGPVPENFSARYELFKDNCVSKYGFNREHLLLMKDLREIIKNRKESPMEFIRKDKYVICSDDYGMKTITIDKVKNYIFQSKSFIIKLNTMFKNARVF
ncbi:MAG: hypothetical protein PHT54_02140 [Candidatus Nanoarchaeia archaeon]|nr:hypothetical protein [Candidatus Nanoarchaeia archaeon]